MSKVKKKKKYFIVHTLVGGTMEMPETSQADFRIVEASSERRAIEIYEEKLNVTYWSVSAVHCCKENLDLAYKLFSVL